MVASMEKHRASIGAFGARMCSKNWKMGFKKRGAQGVRSDSGFCPSHHLRVFLFVFIAVMISLQNTENHTNTKQGRIKIHKIVAGNY